MLSPDHIVYGTRDLAATVADLERRLGVRAAAGGKHAGRGTHNALLGLGVGTYLEVIAPDPDQEQPATFRFGLETLAEPRIVAWAMRPLDLEATVRRARDRGYDPGAIQDMHRVRPDGTTLRWRLTADPRQQSFLIPFLIDWLDSPHPSLSAPGAARLVDLRGEHPDPSSIERPLAALGSDLPLSTAATPALVASIETGRGVVELR